MVSLSPSYSIPTYIQVFYKQQLIGNTFRNIRNWTSSFIASLLFPRLLVFAYYSISVCTQPRGEIPKDTISTERTQRTSSGKCWTFGRKPKTIIATPGGDTEGVGRALVIKYDWIYTTTPWFIFQEVFWIIKTRIGIQPEALLLLAYTSTLMIPEFMIIMKI